jgi:hypothetical protein
VSDRRQDGLLASDRPTSSHERDLRGSDFGVQVRTVHCEKDRKLLSRLHASSDTGTSRRANCSAEHKPSSHPRHQAAPEPLVAQNWVR